MLFKVGDKVRLLEGYYGVDKFNPINCEGIIILAKSSDYIRVKWEIGTENSYKEPQLLLLGSTDKIPEKWFIVWKNEEIFKTLQNTGYVSKSFHFRECAITDSMGRYHGIYEAKYLSTFTEINFEDFKKHILKIDNKKEVEIDLKKLIEILLKYENEDVSDIIKFVQNKIDNIDTKKVEPKQTEIEFKNASKEDYMTNYMLGESTLSLLTKRRTKCNTYNSFDDF